MKLRQYFLALCFVFAQAAGVARAAEYKIDTDHSSITFKVKHLSISTVMGKFSQFSGTINFDDKKMKSSKVEVTIIPDSVDTGVKGRDDHLRSDAFFEVKTYPTAVFKSTQVSEIKDGKFTIKGNLTLHGVTKPVVLNAQFDGAVQDDQGNHRVAFSADTEINRQDYGIDFSESLDKGGLLAANEVRLNFELEAILASDIKK